MADAKPLVVQGRRVMFSRAMNAKIVTCRFCRLDTQRCLAHKLESDPAWDFLPCCDFCFAFLQKLESQDRGL